MILATAGDGSKEWLTSPLAPKKAKFMRSGIITLFIKAERPDWGRYTTMVKGYVMPPTENDEEKCGNE